MLTTTNAKMQWKDHWPQILGVAILILGAFYLVVNNRVNAQEERIAYLEQVANAQFTALDQEQTAKLAAGQEPVAPLADDVARNPEVVPNPKRAPIRESAAEPSDSLSSSEVRGIVRGEIESGNFRLPQSEIQRIAQITAAIIPKPIDGTTPTPAQIRSVVQSVVEAACANDACKGKPGDPPNPVQLDQLIGARLDAMCGETCEAEDGSIGPAGPEGPRGASAYEIWLNEGNEGSIDAFLASLKGETGDIGAAGRGITNIGDPHTVDGQCVITVSFDKEPLTKDIAVNAILCGP